MPKYYSTIFDSPVYKDYLKNRITRTSKADICVLIIAPGIITNQIIGRGIKILDTLSLFGNILFEFPYLALPARWTRSMPSKMITLGMTNMALRVCWNNLLEDEYDERLTNIM